MAEYFEFTPWKITRNIQWSFSRDFILIIPDLLINKVTLFIEFQAMPVKIQFSIAELSFGISWNKIQSCTFKDFLQSITSVLILTVVSKQNKFHYYLLLLNFIKYYFHLLVFCFFVTFVCFGTVSLCYITIYILVLQDISIGHLERITLGFVDVRVLNPPCTYDCIFLFCYKLKRLQSNIFDFLRLSVNMCTLLTVAKYISIRASAALLCGLKFHSQYNYCCQQGTSLSWIVT